MDYREGTKWSVGILVYAVLVTFIELVNGQCNGASQTITTGSNGIKSPNFGTEHGKAENCSWIFHSISNENALILTVTKLKLYHIINGGKICSGSYNLIINGEKVQCDRYVNAPATVSFCKSFYFDSSCRTLSAVNSCETAKLVTFPLEVKYEADGKIYGSSPEVSRIWGFRMDYKFIKCPSRTTASPTTELTVSTAGKLSTEVASIASTEITQTSVFTTGYSSPTIQAKSTTATHGAAANSSSSVNSEAPSINILTNGTSEATLIAEDLKPNCFPLSVVAGVSGAGGFFLILAVVMLTISLCFKTRWRKNPDSDRNMKGTPEEEYETPISHHKYEDIKNEAHHGVNVEDSTPSKKWVKTNDHDIEPNANAFPEGEYEPRYGSSHHKYEDVESAVDRGVKNEDSTLTETPGYESFSFSAVNPPNHHEVSIPNPNTSHKL